MLCTFNSLVLIFGHFHIQIPMKLILESQFKLQAIGIPSFELTVYQTTSRFAFYLRLTTYSTNSLQLGLKLPLLRYHKMTITATFDVALDRTVAVPLCFRKFGGTIPSLK